MGKEVGDSENSRANLLRIKFANERRRAAVSIFEFSKSHYKFPLSLFFSCPVQPFGELAVQGDALDFLPNGDHFALGRRCTKECTHYKPHKKKENTRRR